MLWTCISEGIKILIDIFKILFKDRQMPAGFRILGFARREKTDAAWRAELREALWRYSRSVPVDEEAWQAFAATVFYCPGDLTEPSSYVRLKERLEAVSPPELPMRLRSLSACVRNAVMASTVASSK